MDTTEKRNNYYIQGPMARHRKFDPERLKEKQDMRELNVNGNFVQEMEAMRKKKEADQKPGFLSSIMQLQKVQQLSSVQAEQEGKDEEDVKIDLAPKTVPDR